MSKFFINRPIFAWVIAIVLMVAGALAIRSLPIAQYPAIAPPSIEVDGHLSRRVGKKSLEDTVTQVIEQKMTALITCVTWPRRATRRAKRRHAHIRCRHEPGHRAGAGAEQVATRAAAPPAGSAETRRERHQIRKELCGGRRFRFDGRAPERCRFGRLHRLVGSGSNQPRSRGRRRAIVRRPNTRCASG